MSRAHEKPSNSLNGGCQKEKRMIKIDKSVDSLPVQQRRSLKVMVSSSIYEFEDQIDAICSYLEMLGYEVISSKEGTLKVDPRLNNFENCYKAVEGCDLFLGIVRPYTGSGREGGKSVTFREFETARKNHKPSWYIIDNRVKWTSDFCRQLELRDRPRKLTKILACLWRKFYYPLLEQHNPQSRLFDLFQPDRSRSFSEACFEMERFVNQRGKYRPEDGCVRNNWMQYCSSLSEMKTFIKTNFADYDMIDSIINEA